MTPIRQEGAGRPPPFLSRMPCKVLRTTAAKRCDGLTWRSRRDAALGEAQQGLVRR
jgi:hypothetical protein